MKTILLLFFLITDELLSPISCLAKSILAFPFGYKINTTGPDPKDHTCSIFVPFENWPSWATLFGQRILPVYPLIPIIAFVWWNDLSVMVPMVIGISLIILIVALIDEIIIPFAMWLETRDQDT